MSIIITQLEKTLLINALAQAIVVSTIVHCILFVEINTFEFGTSSSSIKNFEDDNDNKI